MTEEEIVERATDILLEAVGLFDADRWWLIEQLAELCRETPQLPTWLVEEFEHWVDEGQAQEPEWIPVADALTDLSSRLPDPVLALVWCRLAWEREGDVLRHVQEADRLAALSRDEEFRALVDELNTWPLASDGHSREALARARRRLREHGPDQALDALVAELLDEEETAATGAAWAATALQEAQARGEALEEELKEVWARLHWNWMDGLGFGEARNRRELAGILTEVATHANWLPDENRFLYAIGFARASGLCGLHDQALGWLAHFQDDSDDPSLKAEAIVVEAEALFGLSQVSELSDLIRRRAQTVAQLGDSEQQGRLAVLANAIARVQLDWDGADRILDTINPDLLEPEGVALNSEIDEISRRVMRSEATCADVDALMELASRSRATDSGEVERVLLSVASMIAAGLGDPRSGSLHAQVETMRAGNDGHSGGEDLGLEFFATIGELVRLARDTPELALKRAQRLRDMPGMAERHFLLLVLLTAIAGLEVWLLGHYRAGLDSVAEGLRLCEDVVRVQRSSRERSRLRHLQLTLVELGLVAAEAAGDKRAIAELIEFQRFQSMPVAKQEPGVDDLPFDRISLLLAGAFEDYRPDDADLRITVVPTTLPWPSRFSTPGQGAALRVPR